MKPMKYLVILKRERNMMSWAKTGTSLVSRALVTGHLLLEEPVADDPTNTREISMTSLEKEMGSLISLKPFLAEVAEKDLVSKLILKARIMKLKWKLRWKKPFRAPAGSFM